MLCHFHVRNRIVGVAYFNWFLVIGAAPLSFNLSPAQQFWKIQLPAAAPTVFTGIRLHLIVGRVGSESRDGDTG
jgi:ABC-type proline/glycine betaine transport system permease subunit